jgi:UDP-N-acetylmuramoyl-tripeptide--D-alanyl-D-alanine ligase
MSALWTLVDMAKAMRADIAGTPDAAIAGISIDTRTIAQGEAFFALTDARDGHDFVEAALAAGAAVAVVARSKRARFAPDARLLLVDDVLDGLRDLAVAARARTGAKIIAVTGSVGKTGTKEALRLALSADGETHASAASYNNHWGVPLSLARCPADVKYAIFEIGMNHAGEITPLVKLVRPHVAIVTTVEPVHLEYFGSVEKIADAKAEIFLGLEPDGAAVINRDNSQYERLVAAARAAGVKHVVRFGEDASCEARLVRFALRADTSCVHADILGHEVHYKLGAPGKHLVKNSLAVLAAVALAGADLALAALALARLRAPTGRGARMILHPNGGSALLIDESYNANPASMAAAIALLGQAEIGKSPNGSWGRRIAVLGDMLELGGAGERLHRALAADLEAARVDLVYCSGPLMHSLFEALPSGRRGGYAGTAAELEPVVLDAIRPGDALMVKGSFGSRMAPIVKALEKRYAGTPAPDADAG